MNFDHAPLEKRRLSLAVTVAVAAVPSALICWLVEPLWVSDAYWRIWGRLREVIPLNAPVYPLLMRIFRSPLGLTDTSVSVVIAMQHALFAAGLVYAALYFKRLRERVFFILLMIYPNYAIWIANSFLKESVANGFLNFAIGAVLRLSAHQKWRQRDAAVYFTSFLGAVLTVYPYAILLSVLPLIFVFRRLREKDRRVSRAVGISMALGVSVVAAAQVVVIGFNLAFGHPAFHSTAGLIGAYKIQNFHVDEAVREQLIAAVRAKTDDPVLHEVIPVMMDPRVMAVGRGEVKKATVRVVREKFGRAIDNEEAESLLSEAYGLTLMTREYWQRVWTPNGIYQYFLYVEPVFYLFAHANDQIERIMSGKEPEFVDMMRTPLSSVTRQAHQRNLETQFSFFVKCFDFHVLNTKTPYIIDDHDDDYTFRSSAIFVVSLVLFVFLFPFVHADHRKGLASLHIAFVTGGLIYVVIMGTIHFHTPRYALPVWTLFYATWALQAAVIDWRAAIASLKRLPNEVGRFLDG